MYRAPLLVTRCLRKQYRGPLLHPDCLVKCKTNCFRHPYVTSGFRNGLHFRTAGAGTWCESQHEGDRASVDLSPQNLCEAFQSKTRPIALKQCQSIESYAFWQRPAQPFSFIDHGACPWQPIVMLFEKMCHFNVFFFPGILNMFRWNLSKRRLSLTAQSKPRLVSL